MKNRFSKNPRELSIKEASRIIWRVFKLNLKIDKFNFVSRIIMTTADVTLSILITWLGAKVVGEIVASIQIGSATGMLYKYAIAEILALIASSLSASLGGVSDRIMFIKWDKWSTIKLNSARLKQDLQFFEDRENQKLVNKVNSKGAWALGQLSDQIIYMYYNILKLALIFGAVLSIGIWAILIITLTSLPRIYTELKRSKLQWGIWEKKGDDYHRHYRTVGLFTDQNDLIEIKLYGLKQKLLHGVVEENLGTFAKHQTKAAKSVLGIESLADLTYEISFGGIIIYLINRTITGALNISSFTFYSGILGQFSISMRNLSSIISRSGEAVLYAKDYFKFLDSQPQIHSPENPVKLNKNKIPEIEFKNVSFAYKSNPKEKILSNLNLTIHPGEHLALVGENGAGKTTIIKLLLRLYDVTGGEILVDGINIKELDLDSYWRQIGVLFQEFNRYPFDIQTNIEFGRVTKEPTKKDLDRAVKLANLQPILKKLPKGINTILDNSFEEGVEPSGGQWQRVALARAFYRDSNILILDEPTAAVDANAEYEIFNNIFANYGSRTALIISHRFSTVKRAKRIVVLEKGQIVEEGSHQDLMKNSKLYAEMFNKQAEGYKD